MKLFINGLLRNFQKNPTIYSEIVMNLRNNSNHLKAMSIKKILFINL